MARTINRVELLGRVGTEPEMRYTQSGTAVTKLRSGHRPAQAERRFGNGLAQQSRRLGKDRGGRQRARLQGRPGVRHRTALVQLVREAPTASAASAPRSTQAR